MTKAELIKQLQFVDDASDIEITVMDGRGDFHTIDRVSIDTDDPDNKLIFIETSYE